MIVRRALLPLVLAIAGCSHSANDNPSPARSGGESKTAGIRVVRPQKRDIQMTVIQPGSLQAYEVTPIYSRISGYVEKYNYNIGDHVKPGDVLLAMWIPDYVEALEQKTAMVKKAEVQIRVAESMAKAAAAKLETEKARVVSAEAGVKRAQASYTRWESEYKRLTTLVNSRVLDLQVRDETYRQFEEAAAARDQAEAGVLEAVSARDQAQADLERARVDVEAARVELLVAQAEQRQAQVVVDYGRIKSSYEGVITQRNVSPGDYLEPGGGQQGKPLFVVEQVDPLRVFVGVPERASYFIHEKDTAFIRFQAIPGATREGKVVRSGFSLNPTTRTLQTEIDLPNKEGHLRPGWYVTVTIVVERKGVWAVPSEAVGFTGPERNFVYIQAGGKPVKLPVIIGPSDDTYTEILRKFSPNSNTYDWPEFDGSERVLVGPRDVLDAQATAARADGH